MFSSKFSSRYVIVDILFILLNMTNSDVPDTNLSASKKRRYISSLNNVMEMQLIWVFPKENVILGNYFNFTAVPCGFHKPQSSSFVLKWQALKFVNTA